MDVLHPYHTGFQADDSPIFRTSPIEARPFATVKENMASEQFRALYPGLIDWILATLAAYAPEARSVASAGFARLPRCFGQDMLANAKFIAVDRVPTPPLAALGLSRFAAYTLGDPDRI